MHHNRGEDAPRCARWGAVSDADTRARENDGKSELDPIAYRQGLAALKGVRRTRRLSTIVARDHRLAFVAFVGIVVWPTAESASGLHEGGALAGVARSSEVRGVGRK